MKNPNPPRKNSPAQPAYQPFVRHVEIEAIRNEARAALRAYDEDPDAPATADRRQRVNWQDAEAAAAAEAEERITGRKVAVEKVAVAAGGPGEEEYDDDDWDDDDDDWDDDTASDQSPNVYEYDTNGVFAVMSGDDWQQDDGDLPPEPAKLFGNLWLQNELCILFADTNVGKSILAVQIADSISRGLPIPGFGLEVPACPVVYFDFELSRQQFNQRYSSPAHGRHPFAGSFFRATLKPYCSKKSRFNTYAEFINNEIENLLLCCQAKVLVLDNITCLPYGIQSATGALHLMQYLQNIKRTYQISILVLAHTPKRNLTRPISRNDLQGSKTLINLADSAFAIGESQQTTGLRYLKQIKQRTISEAHGAANVCLGAITKTGPMLHFTFSGHGHEADHLATHNEQYRRETETRILHLSGRNRSIRQMAAELGLSAATVFRTLKRNTEMERYERRWADEEKQCADEDGCADVRMEEKQCADQPGNGLCDSRLGAGQGGVYQTMPTNMLNPENIAEKLLPAPSQGRESHNPALFSPPADQPRSGPCDSRLCATAKAKAAHGGAGQGGIYRIMLSGASASHANPPEPPSNKGPENAPAENTPPKAPGPEYLLLNDLVYPKPTGPHPIIMYNAGDAHCPHLIELKDDPNDGNMADPKYAASWREAQIIKGRDPGRWADDKCADVQMVQSAERAPACHGEPAGHREPAKQYQLPEITADNYQLYLQSQKEIAMFRRDERANERHRKREEKEGGG